ncbi:glycosyltransferase [uncultured Methanospirillum sp.]|uniref:glycosyltransferase family 4 protein n=1 Tax=uncultured Methanospirillum sp. TaxID=262503 RepID=UPI0029C76968|nr:glycosyltransferase [uncultured Methanospirillum sp.]
MMKKIKVFLDYPTTDNSTFMGLSYPQVLYDYLKTDSNFILVKDGDPCDIIMIFNGGSHYAYHLSKKEKFLLNLRTNYFYNPYLLRLLGLNRYYRPNLDYEARINKILARNPHAKIIHRLDDRYLVLCKVYGYDETISKLNQKASITILQSQYCKTIWETDVKTIFGLQKGLTLKNPVIIGNPVDRKIFNERGEKFEFKGKIKILHVAATGMPRKGLGTVLEFATLLKNNPEIHFILVGRQELDPLFGYRIKTLSNVTQIPLVIDRYELAKIYRGADLLIFPSINDCSPNTVIEALSCGLPILCADSGGIPEIIKKPDLLSGLFIDTANPIFNLKILIENLSKFKENAIENIKRYHDINVIGPKIKEIIITVYNSN